MKVLKEKYKNWQKKTLSEAPLRPYELTADGLALLRRNIIVSTMSLFATLALISIIILMFQDYFGFLNNVKPIFRIGFVLSILASIALCCRVLDKSTGYLMETGLWWHLSVDDTLQDEWERKQKHLSAYKSFEWILTGLIAAFVIWFFGNVVSYFAVGHFLSMPPFHVTAPLGLMVVWGMILLPLIHAAWTLEPIVDDEASLEDMQPHIVNSKEPEAKTKAPKSWGQRILGFSPYVVGGFLGVWLVSHEKGGAIYGAGYDLGHWFAKLLN